MAEVVPKETTFKKIVIATLKILCLYTIFLLWTEIITFGAVHLFLLLKDALVLSDENAKYVFWGLLVGWAIAMFHSFVFINKTSDKINNKMLF